MKYFLAAVLGSTLVFLVGCQFSPKTPDEMLLEAIAQKDHLEVAAALEAGADPNVRNSNGRSALRLAISAGRPKIVEQLVKAGVDVTRDKPLLRAAEFFSRSNIETLVLAGAEVNVTDHVGRTPLYSAAIRGDASAVSLLLEHGADPNAANIHGNTPLTGAKRQGHLEVVIILEEAGAKEPPTDSQ